MAHSTPTGSDDVDLPATVGTALPSTPPPLAVRPRLTHPIPKQSSTRQTPPTLRAAMTAAATTGAGALTVSPSPSGAAGVEAEEPAGEPAPGNVVAAPDVPSARTPLATPPAPAPSPIPVLVVVMVV